MVGLGVNGKFRAGKDYFLKEFQKHGDVKRLAFGDVLKNMCGILIANNSRGLEVFHDENKNAPAVFPETFAPMAFLEFRVTEMIGILLCKNEIIAMSDEAPGFGTTIGGLKDRIIVAMLDDLELSGKGINFFTPKTRGQVLQWFGTNVMRQRVHPDTWVIAMRAQVERCNAESRPWMVVDVRFSNEVDFLWRMGVTVIRVEAPEIAEDSRDPQHPSETGCDHIPLPTFVNDRSIEQQGILSALASYGLGERLEEALDTILVKRRSKFFCAA